nr:hypothetical protein [Tanacetum cinerariifolium]GEW87799.1 hypothetical protein [Tanacetum cinerariifolium]
MPQRWLSATRNRLEGRVPLRVPFQMFSRYIQRIPSNKNAEEDEEKTAFITSQGIFCYSKMSFGLKNAGTTYQRLVEKAFQKQIGQNLKVYVDDLVIKSCTKKEVIRYIKETFKTLREINIKLNPKKCAFGMREDTFLGYKVDADGLRKCTKKSDFQWIAEVETVFKQIKKLIAELPMLTAPKEKKELIMYLVAAKEAISTVLMTKMDGKQMPIYFISRALQGPKVNYTPIEKLILDLIRSNPKVAGRLLKWRFELEEHDNHYRLRIIRIPDSQPPDSRANGIKNLQANVDSKLVANRVNGVYVAKELSIIKNLEKVKNLASAFEEFSIKQVPRGENKKPDALSKMSSTSFAHPSKQRKFFQKKRGRQELYTTRKANYVLREIHKGSCSMHADPRSMVAKALRLGDNLFKDWYEKLCIRKCFASVKHPQANGLVEKADRSFGEGIKARLDERSKNWLEEISHVLWAHRNMIKSSNGETPFLLMYGAEAVIPIEIGMPTLRTTEVGSKMMKPWELT